MQGPRAMSSMSGRVTRRQSNALGEEVQRFGEVRAMRAARKAGSCHLLRLEGGVGGAARDCLLPAHLLGELLGVHPGVAVVGCDGLL